MSKPVKVFAQEWVQMSGRGFTAVDYVLDNGHQYDSICLFESKSAAQSDLDRDIEDKVIEAGNFFVVALTLSPNGSLVDKDGSDVITHFARQFGHAEEKVRAHLVAYYQDSERKLRLAAEASSDSPSP